MSQLVLRQLLHRAPRVPGALLRHPYWVISAAALLAAVFTVAVA